MRRVSKDNVIIEDLDQDSDEWLEWRNAGIGSSDIALLMSPEPVFDRTIRTLWEQRVGYERTVELDNEHIRRGKELEPIIRDKVMDLLYLDYKPLCVRRYDQPYLRASLDGYNHFSNSILEIKSPSEKVFKSYLDTWTVPYNYYLQMQYQMLVSGADFAYFAFYNKDILDSEEEQKHVHPYLMLVEPDFKLQLEIEQRCSLFWHAVENKIPIGWDNDELTLFPQYRKVLYLIVDDKQREKILNMNLPVPVYEEVREYVDNGSAIYLISDLTGITHESEITTNLKKRKILSLVESPFCNEPYPLKLNKSSIMKEFNSV